MTTNNQTNHMQEKAAENLAAVEAAFKRNPFRTIKEVSEDLALSPATVQRHYSALRQRYRGVK